MGTSHLQAQFDCRADRLLPLTMSDQSTVFAPYTGVSRPGYTSVGVPLQTDDDNVEIPKLFQPLTIRGVTIKNRVAVSPMCMYSYENGVANHFALVHLGSLALGGAGLVIMEATAVEPIGRITPGCHGLWSEEHMKPCKEIVDFIHTTGAKAAIQIGHAGRKASTKLLFEEDGIVEDADGGWEPIGPSANCWGTHHRPARAMTVDEIKAMLDTFERSALLA